MIEVYKTIEDYPNYEVSNFGSVRNIKTGRVLRPSTYESGYQCVGLYLNGIQKYHLTHRLVASTFIPNPEHKRTVNHINGIKTDNRVENLEWATDSENIKHAYKTGLNSRIHHCRCIETGQVFESISGAARYFGCYPNRVHQSIHKRCRCKGYHFELI